MDIPVMIWQLYKRWTELAPPDWIEPTSLTTYDSGLDDAEREYDNFRNEADGLACLESEAPPALGCEPSVAQGGVLLSNSPSQQLGQGSPTTAPNRRDASPSEADANRISVPSRPFSV